MNRFLYRCVVGCLAFFSASAALAAVEGTPHNLAASSIGVATVGSDTCSFCHTPHMGRLNTAAWDQGRAPTVYKLYESSTLLSITRQPTGSSRLCLSCHDGITAAGTLAGKSTATRIRKSQILGSDLSDDHPVSIAYDDNLATRHGELADPATLPRELKLDASKQVQCTTCHDPHEEKYRYFLRMDDRGSVLCVSCHRQRGWETSIHAALESQLHPMPAAVWSAESDAAASRGGCGSCHQTHNAPRPVGLLRAPQEREVCLSCHGTSSGPKSLEPEIIKPSAHSISVAGVAHTPREDPQTMPQHVTCSDCHNPHQAGISGAVAPAVRGALKGVMGVNISGTTIAEAANEYEVCLKCHGVRDSTQTGAIRQDDVRNIRLKIAPSNTSYHPVAAPVRDRSSYGLRAGLSASSLLYCTDCHNNDEAAAGTRPRGPHGSRYAPILELPYEVADTAQESPTTYALCYKCHDRDHVLRDQARSFSHAKHVVAGKASCAVCHDAHGSRMNPGLINFMLRDSTGKEVVGPSATLRRLEFISQGPQRGQCYLTCHGKNHEPASYP